MKIYLAYKRLHVFWQVMHMFQENLLNDGFDLIAAEIFSDDPKSSIESLKVSLNKDLHILKASFQILLWSVKRFLVEFEIRESFAWGFRNPSLENS